MTPVCAASGSASDRSSNPLAAPATLTKPAPSAPVGGRFGSGRNVACASSQISLPPQCDQRCTTGDQPPDMATASQAISSVTAPSPTCLQTATPVTRLRPCTLAMP